MPDFKDKLVDAASKLFLARLEVIDAILAGANPLEVMMVCAHALAAVAPDCCEQHLAEFEAELLRHLRECMAQQQEAEDAADEEPAPPVRH
jgi:hypothetical protein